MQSHSHAAGKCSATKRRSHMTKSNQVYFLYHAFTPCPSNVKDNVSKPSSPLSSLSAPGSWITCSYPPSSSSTSQTPSAVSRSKVPPKVVHCNVAWGLRRSFLRVCQLGRWFGISLSGSWVRFSLCTNHHVSNCQCANCIGIICNMIEGRYCEIKPTYSDPHSSPSHSSPASSWQPVQCFANDPHSDS